jgi:hypothetical protein
VQCTEQTDCIALYVHGVVENGPYPPTSYMLKGTVVTGNPPATARR